MNKEYTRLEIGHLLVEYLTLTSEARSFGYGVPRGSNLLLGIKD